MPVFVDAAGVRWRREGECCRCGQCCQGDPFLGAGGEAVVAGYCPLFRWDGPDVGRCSDRQHPYYLGGCADFPSHPDQIADKPRCSYSFARVG